MGLDLVRMAAPVWTKEMTIPVNVLPAMEERTVMIVRNTIKYVSIITFIMANDVRY